MNTKTRTIYPSATIPSVYAKSGRNPGESIPLRWIEQWLTDISTALPLMAELDSVEVFGFGRVVATYQDQLSVEERLADLAIERQRMYEAVKALLPREGEPMTAEQVNAIRAALGLPTEGAPVGTPAAEVSVVGHTYGPTDVLAAKPADRKQVFLNAFVQSGFDIKTNMPAITVFIIQNGVTLSEADEWLDQKPGFFAAFAAEHWKGNELFLSSISEQLPKR